jgi:tetratricopeptide (TPR) repeat protein
MIRQHFEVAPLSNDVAPLHHQQLCTTPFHRLSATPELKLLLSAGKHGEAMEVSLHAGSSLMQLLTHILSNGLTNSSTMAQLDDFVVRTIATEPTNVTFETAQLLTRVSDQSIEALSSIKLLLDHNDQIGINSDERCVEAAYHLRSLGNYDEAIAMYREALQYDRVSFSSMLGIVSCHLINDNVAHARKELEFLLVMHEDQVGSSTELAVIESLVSLHHNVDVDKHVKLLQETMSEVLGHRIISTHTIEEHIGINPQFLLEVSQQLIKARRSIPDLPLSLGYKDDLLQLAIDLLQKITVVYPGSLRSWTTLAKTMIANDEHDGTIDVLERCARVHTKSSIVQILLADAYTFLERYDDASLSLDQAASIEASCKSYPWYKIVQSKILLHEVRLHVTF